MKIINAQVITPEGIIDNGVIITENNIITYVGKENDAPKYDGEVYDAQGRIAGPGFVDTHCHGGSKWWAHENPSGIAKHHLKGGTTSLFCSFWRNAVIDGVEEGIERVRCAMNEENPGNIRGIHMEGPYLSPRYGTLGGKEYLIDKNEYLRWMDCADGIIKYWTLDPEREGAEEFAKECQKRGIVLGICYSDAPIPLIEKFTKYGLKLGSHIMCATGAPKTMFGGTKEPGSDEYVLVSDDMYAEVIADSMGAHVRPLNVQLIYKIKGYEKIIIMTDCCTGGDDMGSDVNIINGQLYGSKLTMSVACRNMKKYTNAPVWEIFKMASENPAKATGIFDNYGSLEVGKIADIVIVDDDFNIKDVVLRGNLVDFKELAAYEKN